MIVPKKRRGPKTTIPPDAKRKVFKESRDSLGSCREVAMHFGLSDSAVRKTEDGESTPNLLTAFMYSLLFDKPLEVLFPDLLEQAQSNMSAIRSVVLLK